MALTAIRIELLRHDEQLIDQLVEWHVAEWGHLYANWGPHEAGAEFVEMAANAALSNDSQAPLTWIARDTADAVVGSVSALITDDLEGFDHLSPWLGSLYVRAEARGRGVGTSLVRHVERWAAAQGIPHLYLFTAGQADMYLALSWEVIAHISAHGNPAVVMHRETAPG